VTVLSREGEWWWGELKGKEGAFPGWAIEYSFCYMLVVRMIRTDNNSFLQGLRTDHIGRKSLRRTKATGRHTRSISNLSFEGGR
jgi:hypothetical protein